MKWTNSGTSIMTYILRCIAFVYLCRRYGHDYDDNVLTSDNRENEWHLTCRRCDMIKVISLDEWRANIETH